MNKNSIQTYEQKLADLTCDYCTKVKKGDVVLIKGDTESIPLIKEIYKAVLKRGALPATDITFPDQSYIYYKYGEPEVITKLLPWAENMYQHINVAIFIHSSTNSAVLQNVDHSVVGKHSSARKPIMKIRNEREAKGLFTWTIVPYVNESMAQNAGMSFEEYSEFVFNACKLNDADPVASWKEVDAMQSKVVDRFTGSKKVRIVGEKTDITLGVDGRKWISCAGTLNMPDGEVYTSPVEDSANGHIYFDIPTTYNGVEAEGVYLELKDGVVVSSSANTGEAFLQKMLRLDEGANKIGEVAFATNMNIQIPTKNILFDEKIGGTIHLAVGASYPDAGGKNESGLHWDLIKNMKNGGKAYLDDVLVYEDGKFLL